MQYKVLLIDDSITQLGMLKLQFLKAGYEVETAKDGGEGYRKVFETAPDLILSDIIMPNLNGYQLCRLIKNNPCTKEVPVVLLTVLDKKIDKFWGSKSGADKFLSKNQSFDEIEAVVRKLIELNPISDNVKALIKENVIGEESVQNQINNILDELLLNSTFLNEFRDLGEYTSREKVLVEKTFELLGSFVDYNVAGMFFNLPEGNEKFILHMDVLKNPISAFVVEKIKRDFFANMPNMQKYSVTDFGHEIVREKFKNEEKILLAEEFLTSHFIPIISDGILLGGLCFYSVEQIDYPQFKFYKTMVKELTLIFKMRYLYSETEYLSVTDGLTGLYNRRHFEYNIEREFLRTKRYPADLSFALVDIDYFKKVNDTYGHQYGDYVLKEISNIIAASFRKTDMIYRYGGEEIGIILTETSLENSKIPLERLREKISEYNFSNNGVDVRITISIGVGTNYPQLETYKDLIEVTDKALYKAKKNGRNQLVVSTNEEYNSVLQQQ